MDDFVPMIDLVDLDSDVDQMDLTSQVDDFLEAATTSTEAGVSILVDDFHDQCLPGSLEPTLSPVHALCPLLCRSLTYMGRTSAVSSTSALPSNILLSCQGMPEKRSIGCQNLCRTDTFHVSCLFNSRFLLPMPDKWQRFRILCHFETLKLSILVHTKAYQEIVVCRP